MGQNTSTLLQEFEKRFMRLSTLDRAVLDTSKVLLFLKVVMFEIGRKWTCYLKMNTTLQTIWVVVKRSCSRFNKRQQWCDGDSSSGSTLMERGPHDMGAPKQWKGGLEASARTEMTTNVVEALVGGLIINELTKMVRELQIA